MVLDFRAIALARMVMLCAVHKIRRGVMVERDFTSYREAFRTNGVVCLRDAIDPASLRMAEEAYNWSLGHPGPGASRFSQPDSSATFYQDLANPNAIGAYR